jgi:hypothetical protein
MAFTGKLGTSDSLLGKIVLGLGSDTNLFTVSISDALSFSDLMTGVSLHGHSSDTLTFSEVLTGFAVKGESHDTLTFTDLVSPAGSVFNRSMSDTLTITDDVHQTHPLAISEDLTFDDDATGVRKLDFVSSPIRSRSRKRSLDSFSRNERSMKVCPSLKLCPVEDDSTCEP